MGFGLLPSNEEMKHIKRAVVSVEKQTTFRQFISVAESHAKKTHGDLYRFKLLYLRMLSKMLLSYRLGSITSSMFLQCKSTF